MLDFNISLGALPVATYTISLVIAGLLIMHAIMRGARDLLWLVVAALVGLGAAWLTLWIVPRSRNTVRIRIPAIF